MVSFSYDADEGFSNIRWYVLRCVLRCVLRYVLRCVLWPVWQGINGPKERLPPDVIVSDAGHVSREPALTDPGAPQQRAAVGADGRPMTSAGSLLQV